MSKNVLLIVSNLSKVNSLLSEINIHIPKILYIQCLNKNLKNLRIQNVSNNICNIYSLNNCKDYDIRVILSNFKNGKLTKLPKPIDILIFDKEFSNFEVELIKQDYNNVPDIIASQSTESTELSNEIININEDENILYDNVVLGGTFDRLHVGHKILLSNAVLRTKKRLVVGVTDINMIKTKKLPELILPVQERISHLRDFLNDIDQTINYEIVPIQDPFGPTKTDPDLDLIVVSAETMRGGEKVNEVRKQNNLKPLKIHCIELVEFNPETKDKETKISSSNKRMDLLGLTIKEPKYKPNLPNRPYIIGLIGGIASGKSVMAERLRKLGATIVDCDKLAHTLYEPGQVCYDVICKHFGSDIVDDNGKINRQKLGNIVFNNKDKLNDLNQIVWPHLLDSIKQKIRECTNSEVIVLEAAVLLRAGWQTECHEIWTCIIPRNEAIKRIMERNNLSETDAKLRIDAQVDNETLVKNSNVIFSSEWSYDYTQAQANKAWKNLMIHLKNKTKL